MSGSDRALVLLGGLAGAAGTALAAAAAHLPAAPSLEVSARFLLLHAPALLALAALASSGTVRPVVARWAGLLLAAGLLLFSGDLALRALSGWTTWRWAAPTGGTLLILGWTIAASSALTRPRRP